MSKTMRTISVLLVVMAAVAILMYRHSTKEVTDTASASTAVDGSKPVFIEIGMKSCTPCIMMAEVMDNLETNFPGKLDIVFHDLEVDSSHAATYKISVVPTQIFASPDGTELFRHEGFYPYDEVVDKWRELGYDLGPPLSSQRMGFLNGIFTRLTRAVEGKTWIALAASFLWGILSILLSPCHLASIPLVVGFIDKQGKTTTRRSFLISFLFSLGILLSIALIGFVTALIGRMAGDVGAWGNYAVAFIFLFFGLYIAGAINLNLPGLSNVKMSKSGVFAAFLLGLIFGIALGPCTFAYMAPVLAIVFKIGTTDLAYAITLLLVYGLGYCAVITIAGGFTEYVQRFINWSGNNKGTEWLKRFCGLMVIIGGLWLLWRA